MKILPVVALVGVLALTSSCASSQDEDLPRDSGGGEGTAQSETRVSERAQTSVGILAQSGTRSYSENELLHVAVGTPAAVDAVVECEGPDYGVIIESHQLGDDSPEVVVGGAQAQARVAPEEVAEVLGVDTNRVVSRFDKAITTEAGGYVGFLVTVSGTETRCEVQLTDASTGEVLADEDVSSNDVPTDFPLYFPKGGASAGSIAALTYPSGDPVLPGYPVKVSGASIDYRVIGVSGNTEQEFVALAPGVYAPYTPIEPDLNAYLDGPNKGDCTVRAKFFPNTGGSCWSGVGPGTEEPPL